MSDEFALDSNLVYRRFYVGRRVTKGMEAMRPRRAPHGGWRSAPFLIALLLGLSPAAAPPGKAEEPSALYQFTVIVTGYDMRSRPSGFAQALRWVLVNVSGEPRLFNDPRVSTLAKHADTLVKSFSYVDQMAGIPYHDEQGTYDRPYYLTVRFVPARIDKALADLGEQPWRGERPVVVPVLTVRGFTGTFYRLSAESPAGAQQRPAFADVARDFQMQVRFPTDADFAAWGVGPGQLPAPPTTTAPDEAVVTGTLEFQQALPGWVGSWHWRWRGIEYAWGIKGVNYDEAFRDIVRGVLRVASGHGAPT